MANQNKTESRVPASTVARARERSRASKGGVAAKRFVICINNGGYLDDLKVRTVYQLLPDESAAKSNYIRIIDETGEDYLYPAELFASIELPRELEKVLLTAT
jgi:hypothetical protein